MYRAGFVSKGWSSLIRSSLPSLVFRQSDFKKSDDSDKFMFYVDEVLRYRNRNNFERCCFDFDYYWFSRNYQFQKQKLDSWIRLALDHKVLVAEYQSISFINCKSLTLDIDTEQWELPGLASMLQNCPELESLTINTTRQSVCT
uniref:Uncharacterized protein n=1 Tax=Chenopodium quinoa TaxID=63459 RepID=A0A803M1N2_CHEQI